MQMNGNHLVVSDWSGPRKSAMCQKHIKCAVADLVKVMDSDSHPDVFEGVKNALVQLEVAMQALGADRDWVCRPPRVYQENGE